MKVRNLINRSGNAAPNQLIIEDNSIEVFQSYKTLIAKKNHKTGAVTVDPNAMKHSNTTSKHLFIFLQMDKKEIERQIKVGSILVEELN
jgi:hypothetical protein